MICTTQQCCIYSLTNLYGPFIFDLKCITSDIILSSEIFAIVSATHGIMIYSFDGRLLSTPRYEGMRTNRLSRSNVSISSGVVAMIDEVNPKVSVELSNYS